MFDLRTQEQQLRILDCAGGPASFNAEMTRLGYQVVSGDPLYQFPADAIAQRIQETHKKVLEGVQANLDKFVWQEIQSPEQMVQIRMVAMQQFLEDLPLGIQQGRYVIAELPVLPLNTNQFDLAVCSHFLFTYSDLLSLEFHLASLIEMCRVATEVRIFPLLLNFSGEVSPILQPVMSELEARGYRVEIRKVPYEFQKGGNQMLCISGRNYA